MSEAFSSSPEALAAQALVRGLQGRLVARLEAAAASAGVPVALAPVHWDRDGGAHGGGTRYQTGDNAAFDRASVNVSVVHYDDRPEKKLGSAIALSAIVHPRHPRSPSMHMHISHTALKRGRAYWRVMADLNPALPDEAEKARFEGALRAAAPVHFEAARAQGDKYFRIEALDRHRGVTHFYLEGHDSGDFEADRAMAERVGIAAIDTYGAILESAWAAHGPPSVEEQQAQLAYHTLYLFQVLTLDRGTTSGLLVHGDNDVGILGSLPSQVSRELLSRWIERMAPPQHELLRAIVAALPDREPSPVTVEAKRALADVVRAHYRAHPEALSMQASGHQLPPTVENHR